MRWTEKQLDVINTRNRNILVSAAAGSGKTAVLVERIIRMITDNQKPIDIDRLLVVTFTRAAASEMKERIRDALEKKAEENPEDNNVQKQLSLIHNAHISTIDSFCASVVRDNFDKIDLDPNFRIADETEIEMLKADIMEEMLEEYYTQAKPEFMELAQQYSTGKLSDNISELISTLYSFASGNHNPEQWVKDCIKSYDYENIEAFENSPIMQKLIHMLKSQMESWVQDLKMACVISESEDGPKCTKGLINLIDFIENAKNSPSYTKMRNAIMEIGTVRLVNVKGCDEDKKKQVSDIKNDIIKQITKIKADIFKQNLQEIYDDVCHSRKSVETIIELTLEFMRRFKEAKAEKGIMDFNDQAHFALKILNDEDEKGNLIPSETAKQMAQQFYEIMIDEYQDSNYVQEAILSAVSQGNGCNNMFMVGDVKQSIYRFRQAEPKLFLGKYDTYSDDLGAYSCKIILDKNFRSRREVIDSVNYIFDFIMHRQVGGIDYRNGNQLALGADFEDAPVGQDNSTEFIMIEGDEKKTEAEYVAQKIREITDPVSGMKITEKGKGMRPVRYGDIAILLRSMKGISDIYAEQLENNGVPAYAESRTGYYQAKEVQTIVSALSVIDNPRQDIPLAAVMVSSMFGFTSNELAEIRSENSGQCFYDYVCLYGENGQNPALTEKVRRFLDTLNRFRLMVPYTSVYEIINQLLEETGYDYYIRSMAGGKKRHMNIEALKEKAVAYDAISYKGLFNFVRYIEKLKYLSRDDGEASTVSENDDIVHIMSIHKSKGLQFPVVFVCNTNAQAKSDTNRIVADDNGTIGVDFIDEKLKIKEPTMIKRTVRMENKEEDMAEMLRILYVALTRAKEKLYITGLTKDVERMAADFANCKYDQSERMSYNHIVGGKSLMDWIGRTIGRNKAFDSITGEHEYNAADKNQMYDVDASIKVSKVLEEDIVFNEFKERITDDIRKEAVKSLENIKVDDESIENVLNKNFSFVYPFASDIALHSKASVTEIKKQSMAYEEELDGYAIFGERNAETLEEIIPDFAKDDRQAEMKLTGAERGTAYHRIFELLDMNKKEYTVKTVKEMLEQFVETGMIDSTGADCVNPEDIVKFTETDLFWRMKSAAERGQLFREQKFLLGVPVNKINPKSQSEETMIIQGIIDVCFIEDGKYVIADYKTDRVRKMDELKDKYHIQLECYKLAIEQISEMTVSDMIIYSVHLGDEITL